MSSATDVRRLYHSLMCARFAQGMAFNQSVMRRWQRPLLVLAALTLAVFAYLTLAPPHMPAVSHAWTRTSSERTPSPSRMRDDSMAEIVRAIYGPMLQPIAAPSFVDDDGTVYGGIDEPTYTESFGKRLLILDVDSRPMTDSGQVMNPEGVKWPGIQPTAAGVLSHYLYAMIHGYDYRFAQAPNLADRHATWTKVPMVKQALMTHDIVVFMDHDAMFHRPHLPLEWLLNHWKHTAQTVMMVAKDPDMSHNKDAQGRLFWNTGFMIVQNSSRTHELLDAWMECPRDTRFPGCSHYARNWPHEQGALMTYIKHGPFNRHDDIRPLPCVEANGSPLEVDHVGPGCGGVFVRHFWGEGSAFNDGKIGGRRPQAPGELDANILPYFTQRLHQSFLEDKNNFWVGSW